MKKNLSVLFVMMLVASMVLSACGGGAPAPAAQAPAGQAPAQPAATNAPAQPAATNAPAQAPGAPAGGDSGGTLIENGTDFDWCEIYVSPASQETWGEDQLGGDQIAVGESFTLQNLEDGTYDIKLTGCDGTTEGTMQVEVSQAGAPAQAPGAPAGGDSGGTLIENATEFDWCEIYVSPASQETWGEDQLGGEQVAVGEGFTLQNLSAGTYDIKLTGCDGEEAVIQVEVSQ